MRQLRLVRLIHYCALFIHRYHFHFYQSQRSMDDVLDPAAVTSGSAGVTSSSDVAASGLKQLRIAGGALCDVLENLASSLHADHAVLAQVRL